MVRAFALILLVFSVLLGTAGALGRIYPDVIYIDQVRPGMRGFGLTVFRGSRPEKFQVEVIDVLHGFRPHQDLILVRAEHPILERAKTVAGMSGSPIYLDGKLAGAYAYGWVFGKEPVTGVTPAANMLAELNRPLNPDIWRVLGTLPKKEVSERSPSFRRTNHRLAGIPPNLGKLRRTAFSALQQYTSTHGAPVSTTQLSVDRLEKIATPILISGMESSVVDVLGQKLERFGLIAMQSGGGHSNVARRGPSQGAHYVDGSAIGVQLIRGDISATAIGTVTHVAEHRLIAFGHPMMNIGQIAWPTTTARVLHVLSSQMRSFKIAEAVAPLGTLIHDRQAAIVVDTGITADTIPLKIRLHGVQNAPHSIWNMEVVSHRLITPLLTFAAIANAIKATVSDRSHLVFKAKGQLKIEGYGVVNVEDIDYTSLGMSDPTVLSNLRLFDLIDIVYGNPFEERRINGIIVDLYLDYKRDVMTIIDALVPQNEVDPGHPVNVQITLRKYGYKEEVRTVEVSVPKSAAGRDIEIIIKPGNQVDIKQPIPENLSDLIDNLLKGYPSTSLVVSTKLPFQGLRMLGHVVDRLPGSAYDTLQVVNQSGKATSFVTHQHKAIPMGMVIMGSARIKLKVRETARDQ